MSFHRIKKTTKYDSVGVKYCRLVVPDFSMAFSGATSYTSSAYCALVAPSYEIGTATFQTNTNYCANLLLFSMTFSSVASFQTNTDYCGSGTPNFNMSYEASNSFVENSVNYCKPNYDIF